MLESDSSKLHVYQSPLPHIPYREKSFELSQLIEKINGRIYIATGIPYATAKDMVPVVRKIRDYSKKVEIWLSHVYPEQVVEPLLDTYLKDEINGVQVPHFYNSYHPYFFDGFQHKLKNMILERLDENRQFEESFSVITSPKYKWFDFHGLKQISEEEIISGIRKHSNDRRFKYFWISTWAGDDGGDIISEHLISKALDLVDREKLVIGGGIKNVDSVKRVTDLGVRNIEISNIIEYDPYEMERMLNFLAETNFPPAIKIKI